MKSIARYAYLFFVLAVNQTIFVNAQEVKPSFIQKSPVAEITETTGTRFISGIYPHLTVYSQSRVDGLFNRGDSSECGIGAVVPWA